MVPPHFATLWWPSLQPFGPTLALAVAVVALAWVLVEIPSTSHIRGPLLLASLVVFSTLVVVLPADLLALSPLNLHIKYKRFPGLSDYLANYLLVAVAAVFALKLVRMKRPWWQEVGMVFLAASAGVLLAEFGGLLYYRYEG